MGTTTISSSWYQSCNWTFSGPFCWQNPCPGFNSEFYLLLFLHILSFNFVTTPRKSLRFTRFIRSYVNRPAVVLTNHCQSYTAFLLDVRCSKLRFPYFAAVSSQWQCICVVEHTCYSNVVNSKVGREASKCEIVINISNLTAGVSIPSASEQRFLLISIQ